MNNLAGNQRTMVISSQTEIKCIRLKCECKFTKVLFTNKWFTEFSKSA